MPSKPQVTGSGVPLPTTVSEAHRSPSLPDVGAVPPVFIRIAQSQFCELHFTQLLIEG